jgi:hypothetical protein
VLFSIAGVTASHSIGHAGSASTAVYLVVEAMIVLLAFALAIFTIFMIRVASSINGNEVAKFGVERMQRKYGVRL